MNPWILAGLLIVVGPLAAAVITFLVGFAGAPGALLGAALTRGSGDRRPPALALLVTAGGQLLVSLGWTAVVYQSVENLLTGAEGVGRYVAWTAAFFAAIAPIKYATRDSALEEKKTAQHHAAPLVFNLTAWIALLFLVFPSLMQTTFGWVPHWGEASTARASANALAGDHAEEIEHLSSVFSNFSAANELSVELGNSQALDPQKEQQMFEHIEAGLAASRLVGDELLNKLHPEMREAFRDHLIRGHEEILAGLRARDVVRQLRGNQLISEWYTKFWERNADEIIDRALGPN